MSAWIDFILPAAFLNAREAEVEGILSGCTGGTSKFGWAALFIRADLTTCRKLATLAREPLQAGFQSTHASFHTRQLGGLWAGGRAFRSCRGNRLLMATGAGTDGPPGPLVWPGARELILGVILIEVQSPS